MPKCKGFHVTFFDCRYEFDPDKYEGEESEEEKKQNEEVSVITSKDGSGSLDKQLPLEIDKNLLTPSPTSLDRSKLKIDLTPDGSEKRKKKLPPRPEDYDYYWYQDEEGKIQQIEFCRAFFIPI